MNKKVRGGLLVALAVALAGKGVYDIVTHDDDDEDDIKTDSKYLTNNIEEDDDDKED